MLSLILISGHRHPDAGERRQTSIRRKSKYRQPSLHRDLFRHLNAQLVKLLHRPDGYIVIASANQRAVGNPAPTQALHPPPPRFEGVQRPSRDKRASFRAMPQPVARASSEAGEASRRRWASSKGAGNKGDIAMAERKYQPLHYPGIAEAFDRTRRAVAVRRRRRRLSTMIGLRVVLNDLGPILINGGEKAKADDDRIAAQIQQVLDRSPAPLGALCLPAV